MADYFSSEKFKATHLFDEIVWHLRANLILKSNRHNFKSFENSFLGKDAVQFLLTELPKFVTDKKLCKENTTKFLQMMVEWKFIGDAQKPENKTFNESRIYIFLKSLEDLRRPKSKSRRSASFSGARKSAKVCPQTSPAATFHRIPKPRMSRRLSRSNGDVEKAAKTEDKKVEEVPKIEEKDDFKIDEPKNEKVEEYDDMREDRKERVYDWLPFFKSKRFQAKTTDRNLVRRSVSVDRNHHLLGDEAPINSSPMVSPPIKSIADDMVYLHPSGPSGPGRPSLTRSKMYESIVRRQGGGNSTPKKKREAALAALKALSQKEAELWKTELINRMECLSGSHPPIEWCRNIDGGDIHWNTHHIDPVDGLVRSRCIGASPDYPVTIVQFMEFLGRYPFSKPNEIVTDKNTDVDKMFYTLANRLEDLIAPVNYDEADLIVTLLCKIDKFSDMIESGKARRWSRQMPIDEINLMGDGFGRELSGGVAIRASQHRRRAISPMMESRLNLFVNDEKEYKLRESWLIEAIQLVLLALPTNRRRKLHKFVQFLRSLSTNELFHITNPSEGYCNNREAVIVGLWYGVCGGYRRVPGMLITAVLLANHRILFNVPEDFVERIRMVEMKPVVDNALPSTRYAKLQRGRKGKRAVDEAPVPIKKLEKEEKKPGFINRIFKKL